MKKTHLVIIDPQQDFCDPNGSLFVPGADGDMSRLATFVSRNGPQLDDIHVTLDSHHRCHIAHGIFWKDAWGNHPNPFTLISVADVENGTWTTTRPGLYRKGLEYVKSLAKHGRYLLCIWPEHCLIGTPGHLVVPELRTALYGWEGDFNVVDWVTKGSNYGTEHYSAVQADVPDAHDPSTQLNARFIETLDSADEILVAGEALSHCVANTLRDVVANFKRSAAAKVVLLTDAMSNVPGFESLGTQFITDMKNLGVRTSTTVDYSF